ncbi:GAF domain-containing protein [Rhodococcus antarcticus]|uniref:GAF domain-containing protein n=1 Tax=Rhodococcus antarcticus TaxID=2987751 RepID=A0ABY6P436_9NOCA|nr:GAF domain-containing protein [Rhodococcus antarcticus]UZJ26440.1 GAF domain-containing protein [Rhodococcus antarcticus]
MTAAADGSKLGLDELLVQLIDRAQDVQATQGRLRGLLKANQAVVADLSLPVLLRHVVAAACELSQARYGALGVLDASGGLAEFVTVGMDEATVARIGHLPEGKGLLGALIDDPRPIRLHEMSDDIRSVGFPEHHPPMSTFLGVPVRVRDVVFGHLYLAERLDGDFTAEDTELVSALAATAGVAIENARLYADAQRRQAWLQASTEVTRQLLSVDGEDPLEVIARLARDIADADVVTVLLPTPDGRRVIIEVAAGDGAAELTARTFPLEGSVVGLTLESGAPVLVEDAQTDERFTAQVVDAVTVGPGMCLPLGGPARARGVLSIGRRRGRHLFTPADLEMASTFADHAAVALELADARTDQQRIALLTDRDRIARDLHDHVIQRLFALGLTVQSVASGLDDDPRAQRLHRVVTDIDDTIRQTRTSIFALRGSLGPATSTVRTRLLTVAAEVGPLLGCEPHLRFRGPIDAVVPEPVVDDLVAVLREALTNAARHAGAEHVEVDLLASTTRLSLVVLDDGTGLGGATRRSGLANLRCRAEQHGGTLLLEPGTETPTRPHHEGTRLTWTIPLA